MPDEKITLILSDLHVGGGPDDRGDDHVYHKKQLVNFINDYTARAEGQAGRFELFFNGDFLEFAQTATEAFGHKSDGAWCTRAESLAKLDIIIAGHSDIFQALRAFQAAGNRVTIAAGNHDVDLYWSEVQQRIREVAGEQVQFAIGQEWVERYGGLLQIGHGHMLDPANSFRNWSTPLAPPDGQEERLEMCPGTLFMVKFVNLLEKDYPFADNLLPVTRLTKALLRDDKRGFRSVAWAFAKFVATTSPLVLSETLPDKYGQQLADSLRHDQQHLNELNQALRDHGLDAEHGLPTQADVSEERLARAMVALLGKLDEAQWCGLFELSGSTLSSGSGISLSRIVRSNFVDGRKELCVAAQERATATNALVVVMGHTHLEDEATWGQVKYYNPGSWTRYLELGDEDNITLDDLKNESAYPYALNVVRVERDGEALRSNMICVDRYPA